MSLKNYVITLATSVVSISLLLSCSHDNVYSMIETQLSDFVKDKDAQIGVAVIVCDRDTIAINGNTPFPMLSVYKFPIAIGVGDYCRMRTIGLGDSCVVSPSQLHRDTWSPMLHTYGDSDTLLLPIRQLLGYAIQQSDNNASDILLDMIGGAKHINDHISRLNGDGIDIIWTEDEMHRDISRSYDNTATPIAMARLLNQFYVSHNDSLSLEMKTMMETCETGKDRLSEPFCHLHDITIGHKTGTGDINPDGRIIAVNDVGYVVLPDGRHYVIAVFIQDSAYNLSETSAMIATISTIVYSNLSRLSR